MILYDDKACPIQWFHCECLRIQGKSKGEWYCPGCVKKNRGIVNLNTSLSGNFIQLAVHIMNVSRTL